MKLKENSIKADFCCGLVDLYGNATCGMHSVMSSLAVKTVKHIYSLVGDFLRSRSRNMAAWTNGRSRSK